VSICAPAPVRHYPFTTVGDEGVVTWPEVGWNLLGELAANPGRLALLAGADTDAVAALVGRDLGVEVVRLGSAVSSLRLPPSEADLDAAVGHAGVVADLDLLAWPDLAIDVLSFLRRVSRRHPLIAVWPGDITDARARYSAPGRPDHIDQALRDAIVLRPTSTRYPDEVPFRIERFV